MVQFPKNFLWGAATSAHQVEGNNHNDWSEWEKRGRVKGGAQSGLAAGHYQRFADDLALAKKLGHNTYRFSIEWSRIMPRSGVVDEQEIDHYRQVIATCRQLGLEPVVTLWHFTSPTWIYGRGGWQRRSTVNFFGQYVNAVIQSLGSQVNYWITINEPTVYTSLGYIAGTWMPGQRNPAAAWVVVRNLLAAHKLAAQMIRRAYPNAKIGTANNLSDFVPARAGNPFDAALVPFARYWHNQWWLDATQETVDFIGLNYYFHHPLKLQISEWRNWFAPQTPPGATVNDLGWPIMPAGLGRLLHWLPRYNRPIIITENGLADANDHLRGQFIRDHVQQIAQAINDGVDVRGYIHWSLLDNFEWAEGFGPRFGLIAVDYHNLSRTIRPSAEIYKKIIQQNGI